MNQIQKFFLLKALAPFNELRDSELGIVTEVAVEYHYKCGQVVASAGSVLYRLYVVAEGGLEPVEGVALPAVVGTPSLLFDYPLSRNLVASRETGALCLAIKKGHLFTIFHECPAFVVGLMELVRHENLYERPSK